MISCSPSRFSLARYHLSTSSCPIALPLDASLSLCLHRSLRVALAVSPTSSIGYLLCLHLRDVDPHTANVLPSDRIPIGWSDKTRRWVVAFRLPREYLPPFLPQLGVTPPTLVQWCGRRAS